MAGKAGLVKLDVGVLTAEQQEKLRQFKVTSSESIKLTVNLKQKKL